MSTAAPVRAVAETSTLRRNFVATFALCILAVGIVAWAGCYLGGLRTFVIATPSMGTVAPVGTLVVTQGVDDVNELKPSEIITFEDPANGRNYTHRIVAINAQGGIKTRGDINPEPDTWEIHAKDVVGKAIVVAPVWGTVLRATPWLAIGGLVVCVIAEYATKRRQSRTATYLIGIPLILAITSLVLRPYVGAVMLGTETAAQQSRASFVSTGLLPSKIVHRGTDTWSHFNSGEVAVLPITQTDAKGLAMFDLSLDLSWLGWLIFILVCLTPAVLGLMHGRREWKLHHDAG